MGENKVGPPQEYPQVMGALSYAPISTDTPLPIDPSVLLLRGILAELQGIRQRMDDLAP